MNQITNIMHYVIEELLLPASQLVREALATLLPDGQYICWKPTVAYLIQVRWWRGPLVYNIKASYVILLCVDTFGFMCRILSDLMLSYVVQYRLLFIEMHRNQI